MPMKFVLSSTFEAMEEVRDGRPHTGVDIPMPEGTELRSIVDGTVERIVDYGTQNIGRGVVIRGEDGYAYVYGHLSKVTVEKGQHIDAGYTVLGLSGNTGNSTGPHLHFGVQDPSGIFIDPTPAVKGLEVVTGELSWGPRAWHWLTTPPQTKGIVNPDQVASEMVQDAISNMAIRWLSEFGTWIATKGLFFLAEGTMVFALFCFLAAISGTGKWMERGVKFLTVSVMTGVASYAV